MVPEQGPGECPWQADEVTVDLQRLLSVGIWDKRLESPTTFVLHHLFKAQGLLVSHQRIEAYLQTVVEHNPWFPSEGSFNLEIWNQIKENVKQASRQGRTIPIDFWPLWALINKAVILPFQGNCSPSPPQYSTTGGTLVT